MLHISAPGAESSLRSGEAVHKYQDGWGGMNKLLRILTFHSVKDLLRYKSFFLLIFLLMLADRIVHRWVKSPGRELQLPDGLGLTFETAQYVFSQLPSKLAQLVFTPEVVLIAAGLFLLKQVISLWPSSDMRRMHRRERGRFGVLEALAALRWYQMVWDALAVATVCLVAGGWIVLAYLTALAGWHMKPGVVWLLWFGSLGLCSLPMVMAGFSYSSKLAVISQGTFGTRFRLFLCLFTSWRLAWTSWLFFAARIIIEFIFVAAIPASAILMIDSFWLRMVVATLSATPVYSYLKMASFKFFLEAYSPYDLVREEYRRYYDMLWNQAA